MDIRQLLAGLASSRVTPAALNALDYVVPGEWVNVTSLEQAVTVYLGVTDPAESARIQERALALWASEPHYQRAVKIYEAVDTADKAVAAAVAANRIGTTFSALSVLDRITPKPDTVQAIDAALKLVAEVAAFASLRGLPIHSLAEAKAFPATLATYAKADMMRLAAWIAIDGILPLGPDFVQKILSTVEATDTNTLSGNPMFQAVKGMVPGSSVEEQKGFVMSTLSAAGSYVSEFVTARGLTREGLAGKLGPLMNVADGGLDVLAATLDLTTDYFTHTGIQSVARALVHDAQAAVTSGAPSPSAAQTPDVAEAPEQGSSWFRKAMIATGLVGLAGAGVTAAGVAAAGVAAYNWWTDDDDEDSTEDGKPDPELDALDDNALAAREAALEMEARTMMASGGAPDEQRMQRMRMMRRRLRRARRQRRMRMGGRGGMGGMGGGGRGGGMGGGGMGGGGGRGGGRGRGGMRGRR